MAPGLGARPLYSFGCFGNQLEGYRLRKFCAVQLTLKCALCIANFQDWCELGAWRKQPGSEGNRDDVKIPRNFLLRESGRSSIVTLSIAVLVIWLLISLAPIKLVGSHDAPIKTAITWLSAFKTALDLFNAENGHYPVGTNGLNELIVRPSGATTNWRQYMDQIPLDPWRHPYRYEFPGKHNTNSYDLSSAGPDGKFGTADDIGNWSQR